MSTSEKSFNQVKSILGKLDRNIDQARTRRLHGTPPVPVPIPAPTPAAQPTPGPAAAVRPGLGRAQPLPRYDGHARFGT